MNPFSSSVDEEYNPFASPDTSPPPVSADFPSPPPHDPIIQPTFEPTPVSTTTTQAVFRDPITGIAINDTELARREAILAEKEARIASKEMQIAAGDIPQRVTRKNFPPFVSVWEFYPEEDLPEDAQKLMVHVLWGYLGAALALLVNAIASFFCFAPGVADQMESVATQIVFALLYLVVFVPVSFDFSYFVIYNGLKTGRATKFFCGLVTYAIWACINIFFLLGLYDGSLGYIVMIDIFGADKNAWVGAVALIYDIIGTLACAWMGWTFIGLIKYYQKNGMQKQLLLEASHLAAEYARDNPEAAQQVIQVAAQQTYM